MYILKLFIFLFFLFNTIGQGKTIAVYVQEPIADLECAESILNILNKKYNTFYLTHDTLNLTNLKHVDCLVFPGGLGDVDIFDVTLKDKKPIVQHFFKTKHTYMGICMGAYIAGKKYFNIVEDLKITQYIKRPFSEIKTEDPTIISCTWNNKPHFMYFFDGPVFLGRIKPSERIAYYGNNETAAILKKTKTGTFIGIGPHPESFKYWYDTEKLKPFWHKEEQHKLILDLVNQALN